MYVSVLKVISDTINRWMCSFYVIDNSDVLSEWVEMTAGNACLKGPTLAADIYYTD